MKHFCHWVMALMGTGLGLQAASAWHHPLYLANGGFWPARVTVKIENPSPVALAGETATVSAPALAGYAAESIRVCTENGKEFLFDVRTANGEIKRSGALVTSDQILLPVECAAKGTTTMYIYAGNELAWAVPDYLRYGLVNGGFESGNDAPDTWKTGSTDAQHVASWDKNGGRNGSRCAKMEVAVGAEPTWVQWSQSGIPVVPGHNYEVSAWVKAEKVVGQAGWFLHVNGEKPQILNNTLNGGSGSFDWKLVSFRFTAPSGAVNATLGTILRGTGKAWYDDAKFSEAATHVVLKTAVGPLEKLALEMPKSQPAQFSAEWPDRAIVRVLNVGQADGPLLVLADLRKAEVILRRAAQKSVMKIVDATSGETIDSWARLDDGVLFPARVKPGTGKEFHVYFHTSRGQSEAENLANYDRVLNSSVNRVLNPSFEQGSGMPEKWIFSPVPGSKKAVAKISSDGVVGKQSGEFTVAPDQKNVWLGWRSGEIPVRSGATYVYSGFLKGRDLSSVVSLHAHFHDASGRVTTNGGYISTRGVTVTEKDWTPTTTITTVPAEARSVQLQLTMNISGTVKHDGILFAEVVPAEVIRTENQTTVTTQSGLTVWEVNPLIKLFPETPPQKTSSHVAIEAGRNEYEPFQMAISSSQALAGVQASVTRPVNSKGEQLPPVKVERVGYVPVDYPSGYYQIEVPDWQRKIPSHRGKTDGWAGWWPDPLIADEPFDLPAGQSHPYWFTVRVPKEAAPGDYRAEIKITAAGAKTLTVPLLVKVLPFTLPDKTRLRVLFDFRNGPGGSYSNARNVEGRRKWLRFMAEHRLGIDSIDPSPTFTYKDGNVTMDATAFDEEARYCLDELGMNVAYTPHFFYAFGWAYTPKKYFGLEPFTPEYNRAFQQAYKLFSAHIKAKGWHEKFVYYISDEPHYTHPHVVDQMKKLCALAHEVDPQIPIYSSTWRHCPDWDSSLDLWGVGQYGCFPISELEQLQKAGRNAWITCDGEMATDTPYLATERMLPYYCNKYGMKGFEFWGLSWWTYNPWQFGWHWYIRQSDDGKRQYWIRYPNGDGYLAYPGRKPGEEGPVSTIRLEQVREGLEDFEVIAMLRETCEKARKSGRTVVNAEKALAQARDLVTIPNAGGCRSTSILPDPDRIPAIRKAVNAALVELLEGR